MTCLVPITSGHKKKEKEKKRPLEVSPLPDFEKSFVNMNTFPIN